MCTPLDWFSPFVPVLIFPGIYSNLGSLKRVCPEAETTSLVAESTPTNDRNMRMCVRASVETKVVSAEDIHALLLRMHTKVGELRAAMHHIKDLVVVKQREIDVFTQITLPHQIDTELFDLYFGVAENELTYRKQKQTRLETLIAQVKWELMLWTPFYDVTDSANIDAKVYRRALKCASLPVSLYAPEAQHRLSLHDSLDYVRSRAWVRDTEYQVDMHGLLELLLLKCESTMFTMYLSTSSHSTSNEDVLDFGDD